jgi:2-amino-4-hydroxy-6-hydroxymethyldihydropteridine diphosphokinase
MLTVSKVYETRAIGFNGRNFYNLVVGFDCQEPALTINAKLKAIEAQHGRSLRDPGLGLTQLWFADRCNE